MINIPGQIELYTHIPVMRQLVERLQAWDFQVCVVFLLDAQFLVDASKFVSGSLTALSTMVNLELPHVNVITKMDLLSKSARKHIERSEEILFELYFFQSLFIVLIFAAEVFPVFTVFKIKSIPFLFSEV